MTAFTGNSEQITFQPKEEEVYTAPEADNTGADTGSYENADGSESAADQPQGAVDGQSEASAPSDSEVTGVAGFQVFDSSGTLRSDARVIGGQVVDASGNPIDGCIVQDDGYVKDAYWNIIDPMTGWPVGS